MPSMKSLLTLTLLLIACAAFAASPYDEAENSSMSRDQRRVRALYVEAAEKDSDPQRRDRARIHVARIDWYILHDAAAARTRLAEIATSSVEFSNASAERSRMECELLHDFDAARKAAQLAYDTARTQKERDEALTCHADATWEQARGERDAGKCPDRAPLADAIAKLQRAVAGSGPTIDRTRLLLDAALLSHDDAAALSAWRWYYADLPALVPTSIADRKAAALALSASRLFGEADLVLRDPCASTPIALDAAVRDIIPYAASVQRLTALVAEHHRSIALSTSDDKAFVRALGGEAATLWRALSWPGEAPPFSPEAAQREVERRFGAVVTLGETDGIFSVLYGHRVADEARSVEQHGHKGTLHFVQLDGIVSDGFAAWATQNDHGTGGWIGKDAMFQVRPMYADGPIELWQKLTDPIERARTEDEIKRETALDRQRVSGDAVAALLGLRLRLKQEYAIVLRDRLASQGLTGDALRDAFISTASADKLAASIWAHEGRHSIDKALGISKSVELEFRAKLSEVVFAPAPRGTMGSILTPVGGKGAHAEANERVLRGIVAWMRKHAAGIAGFDASAPTLTQLDRLTDDQLRVAFRTLDPLAP